MCMEMECEDLLQEEAREFPSISAKTGVKEGMKILVRRLGLNARKVQEMARDRMPSEAVRKERGGLASFYQIKSFLKSDLVFSDILHAGYGELRHMGMGRRFLVNRILRAVLAGMCDSIDSTGTAGDFPPRSWKTEDQARKIMDIQKFCLEKMTMSRKKVFKSVKVRLGQASTQVLKSLADKFHVIRTEVRKASVGNAEEGMAFFSRMLTDFRGRISWRIHCREIIHRRDAKKKKRKMEYMLYKSNPTWGGTRKLRFTVEKHREQTGPNYLRRGLTDLKRALDPGRLSWYRRPSDEDWNEGRGHEKRKPRTPMRKRLLEKYGFGMIPGLTEPLEASEWSSARTDWKASEVREMMSAAGGNSDGFLTVEAECTETGQKRPQEIEQSSGR